MKLHIHKWEVTGVHQNTVYPQGVSRDATDYYLPTSQHTTVAMRCTTCGDLKTKKIDGHFTVDELKGSA